MQQRRIFMRLIATLTLAFVCGFAMTPQAQETKTKEKIKGSDAKTVTFTGCVQSGTEARSYILNQAIPIGRTTTVTQEPTGTSGVSTTTTYALVPGERIELEEHVGHKVQVTGVMIPGGDVKTEMKTKRENSRETRTEEKTKTEKGSLPQFRVISVTHLAESCS
jgi:hypothetical protein